MEFCEANLKNSLAGPYLDYWTLSNNVRCVSAEMPECELTCLDFWCKAGSSWEYPKEEGIAHFLEHMVFKGSSSLEAGAFDRQIEALGGTSNAATGFDDVHFHVVIPYKNAEKALELLLDLVLLPSLKEEAFVMEREVVLEEMSQYADQPDEKVLQALLTKACNGHSYGRPILGMRSSLLNMNTESMKCFHKRRYVGENCCLAMAGPDNEKLRNLTNKTILNELMPKDNSNFIQEKLNFKTGQDEILIERLESARFLMIWPMASANCQDLLIGTELAITIISEGRRSRLIRKLQEELQIVDTIDIDFSILEYGSFVTLEIACQEKNLEAIEIEIDKQLNILKDTAVEDWELERASALVHNGVIFSMETTTQVAAQLANQTLWNRPQQLLKPLNYILNWTTTRLQKEIFNQLQLDRSFRLIAKPEK